MRNYRLIASGAAVVLAATLISCGTVLNVAGYRNTLPTVYGPEKGRVRNVPPAAIFGGTRLDFYMCESTGRAERIWPFGESHVGFFEWGKPTYCLVGWWPTPPACFWGLDMPVSFMADLLILPVTLLLPDPGPKPPPKRARVDPDRIPSP